MRRLFWLVAGVTLGVLVFRKLQQTAEKFTASNVGSGLSSALSDLARSAGDFVDDVRAAMAEQEAVLREGAELDGGPGTGVTPARTAVPPTAPEGRPA